MNNRFRLNTTIGLFTVGFLIFLGSTTDGQQLQSFICIIGATITATTVDWEEIF